MSYEYRLLLDDPRCAQQVMQLLRSSADCVRAEERAVELKDPGLGSGADYDLRLTLESEHALWLELLFKTPALYGWLHGALQGCSFRCFEDGDLDDEVALEQVFCVRQTPSIISA